MNWGFVLFTQIIISLAVIGLLGWSIFIVVRSLVQQKNKK